MAVPTRRTSKRRKHLRRTHFVLVTKNLARCANCGASIQSHRICPQCGFYRGRKALDVKAKAE